MVFHRCSGKNANGEERVNGGFGRGGLRIDDE